MRISVLLLFIELDVIILHILASKYDLSNLISESYLEFYLALSEMHPLFIIAST